MIRVGLIALLAGAAVLPAPVQARPASEGVKLGEPASMPKSKAVPPARLRVTLRGKLKLDGAPFDSQFLGAVVRRPDGLMTPCQLTLPRVTGGRYEIRVLADQEASGCGVPGARVELWTFAGGRIVYSAGTVRWPAGRRARFNTTFSTAAPDGAGAPLSQFAGEAFGRDGISVSVGTRVEAFVGSTRCAVTSVRRSGSFLGFSMNVVGPDIVPGCTRGGTLKFRVGGRRVFETAVNEPGRHPTLALDVL